MPGSSLPGTSATARRALAAIVLGFVLVCSAHALTVRPFFPADETAHTSYALVLSDLELPTIDTPVPFDRIDGMPRQLESRARIYTANHPPLYYALVAPVLWSGVETDHADLGFFLARLLSVGLTAAGIVAVACLAQTLMPGRDDVMMLAAGLSVLAPGFVHLSALVHNDGFSFAVAAWTMAISARVLVDGPSTRRLAFLVAVAAAAPLTRATGIGVAAIAIGAAALAPVLHDDTAIPRRLGRGVLQSFVVAASAIAASGWFWWRNHRLYGDLAGSEENLERFGFEARSGSTLDRLLDPNLASTLYQQLFGRLAGGRDLAEGWWMTPAWVLLLGGAAGLVFLGLRALRDGIDLPMDHGRLIVWSLLIAWTLALWISVLSYFGSGGGLHARYLFPALPGIAVLAGVALCGSRGPRARLAAVVLTSLLALNVVWLTRFLRDVVRQSRDEPLLGPLDAWIRALDYNDVPAPSLVVVIGSALLVLVATIIVKAGWALDREVDVAGNGPPLTAPRTVGNATP